jgi:hypothetical protein
MQWGWLDLAFLTRLVFCTLVQLMMTESTANDNVMERKVLLYQRLFAAMSERNQLLARYFLSVGGHLYDYRVPVAKPRETTGSGSYRVATRRATVVL